MSVYRLGLALGASIFLTGCFAAAPPLTGAEVETREQLSSSQYQPAPREIRDNIETQELLAQAAFWSHEYNLNPVDLEAAMKFSAVLRKMGNASRAVEITRTTRALYPKDPYLNAEHAAALISDQQPRPALKILDKALNETPAYGRLWSLKGVALDQMEKYVQARPFYNRALQITPNDPNIMANLGLNYALSGDPHTARQWLSRAASHPNASDSVHANLELVEGLVAQSAPIQSASRQSASGPSASRHAASTSPFASRTAPANIAPSRSFQARQSTVPQTASRFASPAAASSPANAQGRISGLRQSYAPQGQQAPSAPRQYGAYQSPQASQPVTTPQYTPQRPLRPAQQVASAPQTQSAAPSYWDYESSPKRKAQSAAQAPQSYPQQAYNGGVQGAQTVQKAAPARDDVLSRIAKNVGPRRSTPPPQTPSYAPQTGYSPAYLNQAPRQAQAQGYSPNRYAPQTQSAQAPTTQTPRAQTQPAYTQQSYPQAPQGQIGYPAPQSPYYQNQPILDQQSPQRRTAARRRG